MHEETPQELVDRLVEENTPPRGERRSLQEEPIQMVLHCPNCHKQHIDEGIWATRPHRTHQCVDDVCGKGCGHGWTPSAHRTFGVFYKDLKFDVIEEPPR